MPTPDWMMPESGGDVVDVIEVVPRAVMVFLRCWFEVRSWAGRGRQHMVQMSHLTYQTVGHEVVHHLVPPAYA